MEVIYTVHSAHETPIDVNATFNGAEIAATVSGYVVELVSEGDTMSHVLRAMPGADSDFLTANFPVGARIKGTFSVA